MIGHKICFDSVVVVLFNNAIHLLQYRTRSPIYIGLLAVLSITPVAVQTAYRPKASKSFNSQSNFARVRYEDLHVFLCGVNESAYVTLAVKYLKSWQHKNDLKSWNFINCSRKRQFEVIIVSNHKLDSRSTILIILLIGLTVLFNDKFH